MVIASSATIIRDKKLLLIKRSNYTKIFPEHWTCPGGRANEKETPEQNVIREAKEEVNLKFKPKELIKTGQYEDRELYRFWGDWSGEVQIQEKEVTDWNWFSYDDAIKLKLAFDYRKVIEILRKKDLI